MRGQVERGEITSFLRQSIQVGGVGRGLYISGVPGTGKTATVYEVVRITPPKETGLPPRLL